MNNRWKETRLVDDSAQYQNQTDDCFLVEVLKRLFYPGSGSCSPQVNDRRGLSVMCALLGSQSSHHLVLRSDIVCVCCQEDVEEARVQGLIVRVWRCPVSVSLAILIAPFHLTKQLPFRSSKVTRIPTGVLWSVSACAFRLRGVLGSEVSVEFLPPPHLANWTSGLGWY
jgi:hypothetical protein